MRAWFLFAVLLVGVAVFVVLSGQQLPGVVASHFGASGQANGYMSRGAYLVFMALVAVGAPLVIALVQVLVSRGLVAPNIPNRNYWLAPERRDATLAFLNAQAVRFAMLLSVFLCFVHWLIIQANATHPPRLSSSLFVPGIIAFLVATVVWVSVFYVRFRRRH